MSLADVFGPGFAMLYGCLLALAALAALALRTGLQGADDGAPDAFAPALHPLEIAYLAGGVTGAMESAVASVRRRALAHGDEPERRQEALHGVLTNDVLPAERAVYRIVAAHGGAIERARREAEPILAPVRLRLQWLKLIAAAPSVRRVQRLQLLLFVTLLTLGASRIVMAYAGDARGGSPDFVVLTLCGVAVWLLAYLRPVPPYRSRRGQRLLDDLRARHIGLLWKLRHRSHQLPANDYALAVALFGEGERAQGEAYAAIARVATPRAQQRVAIDPDAPHGW
jgi:uncharacterized protein (TIGR04222 family)